MSLKILHSGNGVKMRADRLLVMLMLLQTRGKMTASTLAEELEVSRRTILRDVNALSLAGVPVYTEGGHGGGIALDANYRTKLTGLNKSEVQALFIETNQAVLRDLGLDTEAQHLTTKMLAALPKAHHPIVEHIQQRLLIDPTWWWQDAQAPVFWDTLQKAVFENRVVQTAYRNYLGETVERTLEPYSLVNKSGHWYLVGRRQHEFRTYRVNRFIEVIATEESFDRIDGFNLSKYWQEHTKEFTESSDSYTFIMRIHPDYESFVKWIAPGRWELIGVDDITHEITLRIKLESLSLAKMLVFGLGQYAEVIEPKELIDSILDDVSKLVDHLQQQIYR